MKKNIIFILIALLFSTFYSCQDEFCIDATTPALTIRFYDKDNVTETKSISLIVWANDMDALYNGTSTDSLSIPLDTQNTSVTYHLSILDSPDSQEDITINYTTEDVFVSKACGFKSVFKNIIITTTNNNWIDSYTTTVTEITNENEAHVKIYH